ncbi:MAG: NAD-dependent epimerase/dehydratase family protein [Solirubrobacteraceae bacterium]
MRIFLAGASGVIGVRLVALLVADGHTVAGMTRTASKADALTQAGAEPVVCDVFDADALRAAVAAFAPDLVMHQLTDLPDDASRISDYGQRNDRIRREGTRNLLDAAADAGVRGARFLAQSIAWELPGERGEHNRAFERMVLDAGGVIIRYGQLYGPDTYYPDEPPPPPRVHVDEAARATVGLLDAEPGVVAVVEPDAKGPQ